MDESPKEFDYKLIPNYIQIVTDTVGKEWIAREVEKIKRLKNESRFSKNRKLSHLYHPKPHPLIEWRIDFEKWLKQTLKSNQFISTETIIKYSMLGKSLEKARTQVGFNKLVERLKTKKEFFSAAFEVEVAASYLSKGYTVEFIEEGKDRTPDLKVTIEKDKYFWVECKCRDAVTERQKLITANWDYLESALLRELRPKKINAAVIVKSLRDPVRNEMDNLFSFIVDFVKNEGLEKITDDFVEFHSKLDPTNNYEVIVRILSNPDEEIESSGIEFNSSDELDRFKVIGEHKTNEGGRFFLKNPMILGFKVTTPIDKVSGIINGFKSAIGQLPKEGPSVIWIRIPDNFWNDNLDKSFLKAEEILKSELSSSKNRRVNNVILMTRIFQRLEDGDKKGLRYRPLVLTVAHGNPRTAI